MILYACADSICSYLRVLDENAFARDEIRYPKLSRIAGDDMKVQMAYRGPRDESHIESDVVSRRMVRVVQDIEYPPLYSDERQLLTSR